MAQLRVATRAEWRSYAGGVRTCDADADATRRRAASEQAFDGAQSIKMDFDEDASSRRASPAVNASL